MRKPSHHEDRQGEAMTETELIRIEGRMISSTEANETDLQRLVAEVRRLQAEIHEWEESDAAAKVLGPTLTEEIDRLNAEVRRLRDALKKVAEAHLDDVRLIARRALEKAQHD